VNASVAKASIWRRSSGECSKHEAGQVAMHREARRVHLVADRAQAAVGHLGLQQRAQDRFGLFAPGRRTVLLEFGERLRHAVQA
jgi:hypothetical protein